MKHETVEILYKYLPADAVEDVFYWLEKKKIHFKITKNRKTKLGDYKPPINYPTHRISVNYNLNRYEFLITFIHELAHLIVYEKYGIYITPHGIEWKMEFKNLMLPFLKKKIFPDELNSLLYKHLQNSKASSNADVALTRALKRYNKPIETSGLKKSTVYLEDIPTGDIFSYENKRLFLKMGKRRTRYSCKEISSGRIFLFHPLAEVLPATDMNTDTRL